MEKLKIALPIIVEGRYDKATLSGYVDANIITTDGFSVFNNKEKQRLIRRLCENGVISKVQTGDVVLYAKVQKTPVSQLGKDD